MKKLLLMLSATFLTVALAQDYYISGESRIGCSDREYYDQLVSYAVQGDGEAFSEALIQGAYAGICTVFEAGEPVYLEEVKMWAGLNKVRRPGEVTGYWTQLEAVKNR